MIRISEERIRDGLILAIILALFVDIFGLSFTRSSQTISADSVVYLDLVRNLGEGQGWVVEGRFFSNWPIGYPAFIFVFHALTGMEPYWASKAVNFLALVLALWFMRAAFKERAPVYASVLLIAQVLDLAAKTWSETVFICLLILFTLALHAHERTRSWRVLFVMFVLCVSLFLTRYIGLVVLIPLAVMGVRHLGRGNLDRFWRYFGLGAATLAVATAYLVNNLQQVGYLTGAPRNFHFPDPWSYGASVLTTQIFQMNVIRWGFGSQSLWQQVLWGGSALFLIVAAAHLAVVWRRSASHGQGVGPWTQAWPYFLLVGASYWCAIVVVRWIFWFGDEPGRLFAPATPLLAIALINVAEHRLRTARVMARYVVIIAVTSVTLNVAGKLAMDVFTDRETLAERRSVYQGLPQGAAVVFTDYLIKYLRPDIQMIDHRKPVIKEGPRAVVDLACRTGASAVYMENKPYVANIGYHPGFTRLIRQNPQSRVIKLGECDGT